ncbi:MULTISPECIES: exosome complex RNA-binding protein Csl4 [Candidatus Nitrosocaldus]|jgi:exosome complex component CSL4|uniref:Exosome complex component Csl4 n=1 Tax=Candidatus Nitrosocaldus cavascurensis TaxID=2058097 RepID=A0A2K5ANZ4_9ARCH|nr:MULTISPECIES: exosome complex RNA-binding protein Csl4 [Candidatus Nitrosocaldus]SPC33363.1 Exosome complex component Csl4 [Candidatus Nitrosocaldus cavascurensis]
MRIRFALPGDRIATIEEFEGLEGIYQHEDGMLRASRIGKVTYDMKQRYVRVNGLKSMLIPKKDDHVIGFIHMLTSNSANIRIVYINDLKSDARFDAIYIGRGKVKVHNMFRVGDMVRAKVVSILNGYIHVTFKDGNFGVIYTRCNQCGGEVVKLNAEEVKCVECNTVSSRKLADDYGNLNTIWRCN